jgi:hypothetical protein
MSAKHLSKRENWQAGARVIGDNGETGFCNAIAISLPNYYDIVLKPPKLKVYEEGRGIILDAKITNTQTGKCVFIEKKTGNNGGNAHERVYKLVSPALKRKVAKKYNAVMNPFFLVFSGATFQKSKYKNEFKLCLEDEQYAVMDSEFGNAKQVAEQIMNIV